MTMNNKKYIGTVRLMKLNGDDAANILSSQEYVTKKERRRIIERWVKRGDGYCVHVLPYVIGKDTPTKDEVIIDAPVMAKHKKKSDPELQQKYLNNIRHIPKRVRLSDYR